MVSKTDTGTTATTESPPGDDDNSERRFLARLSLSFGILGSLAGISGLVGLFFGFTLFSSLFSGYKSIAFSAALAWIFFGGVLAINAIRPLEGIARVLIAMLSAVIALIAAI